jgi:DNA-binding response OmpR family regulator
MNRRIKFLRWPADESLRHRYKREGVPCLLVVDPGAKPPTCTDLTDDWIRSPAPRQDIEARIATILRRLNVQQTPFIDSSCVLHFDNKSTVISPIQAELLKKLVANYGDVVHRDELEQELASFTHAPTRNSLDLHIMRIRRRISGLGLCLETVWGRGYILEPQLD